MSTKIRRAVFVGVAVVGGVVVAAVFASLFVPEEDFEAEQPAETDEETHHEDIIRTPPAFGRLTTDRVDDNGDPVGLRCTTCHTDGAIGEPPAERPDELTEFHTDMQFGHGEQTCSSCHATQNRDRLQLADGSTISYDESMQLCAQCHSSKYESYQHGAHGGMSGHWDSTAGPRVRNHCVMCHDPHDPEYPQVMPADPPRDRFFGNH